MSPVLRVLLERARVDSRVGQREDKHTLCLAIEGGGMRGAVTAGMCFVLEAAGLTGAFDRVYGVSAGALNGWATAAGQAMVGAMHYLDAVTEGVVDLIGPLRGRPLVDFDRLFADLIARRRPLSFTRLQGGPEFRALATSLETMSLRVLAGFEDIEEVLQAVRASTFLPRYTGHAPLFRGERMADGSLIEPIPFSSAAREGGTHVLVLRSRPASYRKPPSTELGELFAVRDNPMLAELIRARQQTYNRQAAELEAGCDGDCLLDQIAVPAHTRLVGPLQASAERVGAALRLGATAMSHAVLSEPVELSWMPVLRRASSPGQASARAAGAGA
jgi:predicted patatin/cPLA2 family phospholipase